MALVGLQAWTGYITKVSGRLTHKTAWSSTIDRARLTQGDSHVTSGIKARNRDAIDPLNGLPIFRSQNSTVQSRGQCFTTNIHLGDETKDKMKEFSSLFTNMDSYAENGVPGVDG